MKEWQRKLYDAVFHDGVIMNGWKITPTWHRRAPFTTLGIEDIETHILEIAREESLDEYDNGEIISVVVGVEVEAKWPRRPYIVWAGVEIWHGWGASYNAYGGEERSFILLVGEPLKKALSPELFEEVQAALEQDFC